MTSILDEYYREDFPAFVQQCRKGITFIDKRRPSIWASEERKIAPGQSPLSSGRIIKYDHAVMPHCVEPMDAADDPAINKIVLWWPIRDGKTIGVCCNIIGRTVTDDPGNIYSVHPIKDDVDRFSTGDIEPMIEVCLSDYFVEKRSRDPGRTITFKKFIGGWLRIVNAGSLTKFRGTSVKVLLLHELDALDPEAIFKAFGRTTGFSDAIIVMESTGTIAPTYDQDGKIIYHSNIHEAYDQGDKRKWFCPCRKCDVLQWLKYDQLWFPSGRMDKAVYLCERCEADHNEAQWRRMQADAKWFPTAGLTSAQGADILSNHHRARAVDRTVRSYWRNGFNSLLPTSKGYKTKLHQFVAEGEGAKTSVTRLMIWKQEIAAELWDPSTEGEAPPPWKPIFDRREDYGLIVPEGGLFLTAFIDCQLNRLEVGWRAWGYNEESWGMDHVVLDGHVRDQEVWMALRQELSRRWEHALGCQIKLGMSFVDGGHYAEDVYRFMQGLARNPVPGVTGRCRASKGVGQHGYPVIDRKWRTVAKALKGYHIGTWEAKDRIYERLRMEPEENDMREGRMHFNQWFDEEYFKGLTVETVTITYERGQEVRKYVNPQQQRNEPLDIEVGNLAAVRLHPKNFDALKAELIATVPVAGKKEALKPKGPQRRNRERADWLKW
jgi:phage terminase large subunit GpA-like protein